MYYWAIVHHDQGSAYGVSFPDIPECFAASDEASGIMRAAIEALDDYFEDGHAAPVATSLEQLRSELSEDLRDGAYLLQVPHIPRPTKSERVNLSFDRGLLAAIDAAAERVGLTRSAYLAMAARHEIEENAAA
ncbi:type II toxin-antitoxin system HicB family antitoxin [Salipiger thiooxidans]|uniref:type II toxin-antitoxin system HicB family antitoxin n=1 Tax=Salipiger thiooxidans TaxID=282683 RepID=UPI001CFBD045|nr:type II toxin-antitoxin system HicB family antitoxin [Salipiger thiooxidans]